MLRGGGAGAPRTWTPQDTHLAPPVLDAVRASVRSSGSWVRRLRFRSKRRRGRVEADGERALGLCAAVPAGAHGVTVPSTDHFAGFRIPADSPAE